MGGRKDSLGRTGRTNADLMTKAGCVRKDRRANLCLRHDRLKCLGILFKSCRIHVRHIIGKDLHLTFLRQRTGQDGIDRSIHVCSFMLDRSAKSLRNMHAICLQLWRTESSEWQAEKHAVKTARWHESPSCESAGIESDMRKE